jgi:uncharacterized YigZ family protein
MSEHFYNTIEQEAVAEFKDRGSRFIGYVYPVQTPGDFKARLQQLKAEHPKAVHYCFAYRLGNDGNIFRVSDDGEPSGSAGRPILGQIDSKNLTNVLVVVVRYFGGTLLGVPGLINAYKTTASLALQVLPMVRKEVLQHFRLQFDYTRMNDVMRLVRQMRGQVIKNESSLFSAIEAAIPLAEADGFIKTLEHYPGIEVFKL